MPCCNSNIGYNLYLLRYSKAVANNVNIKCYSSRKHYLQTYNYFCILMNGITEFKLHLHIH